MNMQPSRPEARAAEAIATMPALAAPQRGPRLASLLVVLVIFVLSGLLIYWAEAFTLEIWATGIGKVIPSSQVQVVQNLEGGIVREVLVHEGDHVAAGDVVARIDGTEAQSSYLEDRANWLGLTGLADRLSAEAFGQQLAFSPGLEDGSPEAEKVRQTETSTFAARGTELQAALGILKAQKQQQLQAAEDAQAQIDQLGTTEGLIARQIDIIGPQVKKGLVSETELLKLQRELADVDQKRIELKAQLNSAGNSVAEISARLAEREATFRAEAFAELAEKRAVLAALSERLVAARDKLTRREIRAPVDGVVKRVLITTPGEVIKPGDTIVEFVATDDDLLIEAKIRPQDIGFIREGQAARVRLSAYDSSIYGTMSGEVTRVGADTLVTNDGASFYPVTIRVLDQPGADTQGVARSGSEMVTERGNNLDILPGMTADVSIVTGERTILDYVFKPILKTVETAFRDR